MSRANEFKNGLTYLKRGIGFFREHKKLWPAAIVPTIINIVVFTMFAWLFYHYYGEISTHIFGNLEASIAGSTGVMAKIWGYTLFLIIYITKFLLIMVMLILTIVCALIVTTILTGWFNEILSARVEEIIRGGTLPPDMPGLIKRLRSSMIVEMIKGLFFIIGCVFFLVLNAVPVIGSAACLIGMTLFSAFFLGFNFVDYPMNRRLMNFSARLKWAWQKRYILTGFGTISLIPVIPFLLSGPLVAGGTILYCEAE